MLLPLAIEDDSGLSLSKKLQRGLYRLCHPFAEEEFAVMDTKDVAERLGIGLDRAWKLMEQFDDDGNGCLDRDEFEELQSHWESHREHHEQMKKRALRHDNLAVKLNDTRDLLRRVLRLEIRGRRAIIACKKRAAKRKLAAGEGADE